MYRAEEGQGEGGEMRRSIVHQRWLGVDVRRMLAGYALEKPGLELDALSIRSRSK